VRLRWHHEEHQVPVSAHSMSRPPQVAFYGDSWTRGAEASSSAKRWSTIVCRDQGWREFNPSRDGLRFIRNRTQFGHGDLRDLIIRQHLDIVIITLGLNDNAIFAAAASTIHAQISADFTRLTHALPHARFVVEPFWYTDARPRSVGLIIGWVKAAAAIHADYIPRASHWIEHHPE
jgi:lysophospholipase L1-like esterase